MSVEVLRKVWLFSELTDDQLDSISNFTFEKTFEAGELIVEEGQTGNGLYVIVSGDVEVLKGDVNNSPQYLAKRGSGDVFGEMALLGEWPRTASVRALGSVVCLGIDRWVFLSQLEQQPKVTVRMLQILAQRLRDSDARFME